jgi:hypothetical protein
MALDKMKNHQKIKVEHEKNRFSEEQNIGIL